MMRISILGVVVATAAAACTPSEPPAAPPAVSEPTDSPAAEAEEMQDDAPAEVAECGPQAPRDISLAGGTNELEVRTGPTPRLCNVHFHDPFEHAGFSGEVKATTPSGEPVCKSVQEGARVEFHWVHTNCDPHPSPLPGLGNCVCERDDLTLRVFARAFVVMKDGGAVEMPKEDLVQYVGSTTGPSYDEQKCSPARVNWEVDPEVRPLSKEQLGKWCASNPYEGEDKPHGSRAPVARPDWLSPFTPLGG